MQRPAKPSTPVRFRPPPPLPPMRPASRIAVSTATGPNALKKTPHVRGLPWLGSLVGMAKGPAEFFVHCYRTYGPVCRLSILGEEIRPDLRRRGRQLHGHARGQGLPALEGILGGLARRVRRQAHAHRRRRRQPQGTARHHAQWLFQGIDQGPLQRTRRDHRRLARTRLARKARKCRLSKPCNTWSSISSAPFSPAPRRWNM